MTPLPPVANTAKCDVRMSLSGGTQVHSILHIGYTSSFAPLSAANVAILAGQVASVWGTNIMPIISTACALIDVTATDLDTATGNQATAASAVSGGQSGTELPAGVSMCVNLLSATRGRSFRGRCFVPGLVTGQLASPELWAGGTVTAFRTAFAAMSAALAAAGAPQPLGFVIPSYYSGTDKTIPGKRPKPIRRVAPFASLVSTFVPRSLVASQRRRYR